MGGLGRNRCCGVATLGCCFEVGCCRGATGVWGGRANIGCSCTSCLGIACGAFFGGPFTCGLFCGAFFNAAACGTLCGGGGGGARN